MSIEVVKVGQNLTVTLDTKVDVTTASILRIDFRKADKTTTGQKTASPIDTTKARAEFEPADLDQKGFLYFQTYGEIAGKVYKGKTYKHPITDDFE